MGLIDSRIGDQPCIRIPPALLPFNEPDSIPLGWTEFDYHAGNLTDENFASFKTKTSKGKVISVSN
jgi:hypothetical protein